MTESEKRELQRKESQKEKKRIEEVVCDETRGDEAMVGETVGAETSCGETAGEASGEKKPGEIQKKPGEILLQLFLSTLYLSTFTFGGGYVIVTLLKDRFVDRLKWINEEEMLDLVAIAQSSPGAIAVNGAIVVGYKLAGLPGILVSVLGAVLPPFVILSLVSFFYRLLAENFVVQSLLSGMRSGVAAVILSVTWDMTAGILKGRDLLMIFMMLAAFLLNYVLQVDVVLIILGAALIGTIRTLLRERRRV